MTLTVLCFAIIAKAEVANTGNTEKEGKAIETSEEVDITEISLDMDINDGFLVYKFFGGDDELVNETVISKNMIEKDKKLARLLRTSDFLLEVEGVLYFKSNQE